TSASGLVRFKTEMGADAHEYMGAWELPVAPRAYAAATRAMPIYAAAKSRVRALKRSAAGLRSRAPAAGRPRTPAAAGRRPDSHRHCAAVPLHRLPARGHLVPWVPARRLPAGHLVPERLPAVCPQGTFAPSTWSATQCRVPTRRVPAQVPPHDFAGTYCWFFAGGFKRSLQHPVIDRVQTTVYPGPRPASPSLGSYGACC